MSLGGYAFYNCSSLTSVIIGHNVDHIYGNAFTNCSSLTSITIPINVVFIGYRAFDGCFFLTSIAFEGTKEQWGVIVKGDRWKADVPATVVHCSNGDIAIY